MEGQSGASLHLVRRKHLCWTSAPDTGVHSGNSDLTCASRDESKYRHLLPLLNFFTHDSFDLGFFASGCDGFPSPLSLGILLRLLGNGLRKVWLSFRLVRAWTLGRGANELWNTCQQNATVDSTHSARH